MTRKTIIQPVDARAETSLEECGWPWWDAADKPHTCALLIGHDNGVHEMGTDFGEETWDPELDNLDPADPWPSL